MDLFLKLSQVDRVGALLNEDAKAERADELRAIEHSRKGEIYIPVKYFEGHNGAVLLKRHSFDEDFVTPHLDPEDDPATLKKMEDESKYTPKYFGERPF